jgi:hypothetical protein
MSTLVVTLTPQNVLAAVRSLRAEFAKADLSGVEMTAKGGAVHVKIPLARLARYHFAYERGHVSWRTPSKKVVLNVKGFAIEQHTDAKAFHMVFKKHQGGFELAAAQKFSLIRKSFFRRSLRAIEELQALDEKMLAEALEAPTDCSVLVAALRTEEALAGIRTRDPLAGARIRGIEAKRKLVETEGGTLSSAEVATALRITRQAVDKRRKQGRLLAVEFGRKGFRYPAWQFSLSNLEPVLAALRGRDGWEQLTFLLNPNTLLDDRTPLEVLREDKRGIDDVLRAASVYGEQAA